MDELVRDSDEVDADLMNGSTVQARSGRYELATLMQEAAAHIRVMAAERESFEGIRDPAAFVQAARDYDALCRELERWDGGNVMPEGHIEASIKVPEALSRLRAELGEGEG